MAQDRETQADDEPADDDDYPVVFTPSGFVFRRLDTDTGAR